MKLDLFKEVKNTLEKLDVQEFISELSDYLKNFIEKINDKLSENIDSEYDNEGNCKNLIVSSEELPKDVMPSMVLRKEKDKFVIDEKATEEIINKDIESAKQISNEQNTELDYLRQEDCLYYVVDGNLESAYLQNLNIDVIFEEVDLPEELKGKIWKDDFLIYKNGEYRLQHELTDDLFESFISISEYERIREEFVETSKIEENNPDIRYRVLSYNEEKETTTLYYEDNGIKEIEVPNKLLPLRVYEWKILYYKDRGFVTDIEATKENYEKWKNKGQQ